MEGWRGRFNLVLVLEHHAFISSDVLSLNPSCLLRIPSIGYLRSILLVLTLRQMYRRDRASTQLSLCLACNQFVWNIAGGFSSMRLGGETVWLEFQGTLGVFVRIMLSNSICLSR